MAVITISGELGSGSFEIAQQVARTLGYELVDKRTTDAIFRQYGLTRFDDLYSSVPSFLDLLNADNLLLVAMANEITEAVARRGNVVIVGRTGFAVLGDYADVLDVHIQAPIAERAQRVLAREGLADLSVAEEQVREDDEVHRKYVRRFYNKEWEEPANYDLVLDTGLVPLAAAVQQIVAAAQALEQQVHDKEAATTAQITVEPVLADAIAKVMEEPLPDGPR
jgi:cytidylate kinase